MQSLNSFKTNLFRINNQNFEQHALDLFRFQYKNNQVYRDYIRYLNINPADVDAIEKIPFLPIQFFKKHTIKTGDFKPVHAFTSSGTTGEKSAHFIEDLDFYKKVSAHIFTSFFGNLNQSVVLGLLPSYLERNDSSLVFMVNHFIEQSKNSNSGFYLHDLDVLAEKLKSLSKSREQIYLFGVTFALLDLAANFQIDNPNLVILETGGMKGTGRELIREDLHARLKKSFNKKEVFSEYGMTELLSQAYMKNNGLFYTPPWMKVFIREVHDPFCYAKNGQTGGINIIDLANAHSCAFIETEDLGIRFDSGFQVIGRLDNSDLRGCNLLLR